MVAVLQKGQECVLTLFMLWTKYLQKFWASLLPPVHGLPLSMFIVHTMALCYNYLLVLLTSCLQVCLPCHSLEFKMEQHLSLPAFPFLCYYNYRTETQSNFSKEVPGFR